MAKEANEADGGEQNSLILTANEIKNRLAAAEYDMKTMAKHLTDGSHPDLIGA